MSDISLNLQLRSYPNIIFNIYSNDGETQPEPEPEPEVLKYPPWKGPPNLT